jgi:hypothetical protein
MRKTWTRLAGAAAVLACAACAGGGSTGKALLGKGDPKEQAEGAAKLEQGAERVTGSAVEGMIERLDTPEQRERVGRMVGQAAHAAGRGLLDGMLAELEQPRQRARVGHLVQQLVTDGVDTAVGTRAGAGRPGDAAAGAAPVAELSAAIGHALTAAIASELATQLSDGGEGSLGAAVDRTAARAVRSSLVGVADCAPGDDGCLQDGVRRLSAAASMGATDGVRERLGLVPLALAFGLGAVGALLVAGAWSGFRAWRALPRRRPA